MENTSIELFAVQGYLMNWRGRFACHKDQIENLLRLSSSESQRLSPESTSPYTLSTFPAWTPTCKGLPERRAELNKASPLPHTLMGPPGLPYLQAHSHPFLLFVQEYLCPPSVLGGPWHLKAPVDLWLQQALG